MSKNKIDLSILYKLRPLFVVFILFASFYACDETDKIEEEISKISIDLNTGQTNLIFDGNDKLTFAGVHIKDEGAAVGTYPTINFVGVDVLAEDSGTPGQVNVYIPTPTFASPHERYTNALRPSAQ